ncbi:hypothetical protein [Zhihengliuella flava]|uniref:Uncharacterized protein n=1 Tax=Zhihengliuella flava TaxID=1285193 RepID=A0A931GF61_9MICC|nr:hypothetical protein [Zhihengliuella flava]MBG6085068.1 hypothetical protein [Zhihengliuella flava]
MTTSTDRPRSFDPYSPASGAVQALASGALALINPADYRLATRRWVRAGLSAGTGLIAGLAIRSGIKRGVEDTRPDDGATPEPGDAPGVEPAGVEPSSAEATAQKASTAMAVTLGAAFAVTCYGTFVVSEWVDARIHHALVRRGVSHPRTVMAVGTAVVSYGLFELDRRTRDADASDAEALSAQHA